MQPTYLAKNQRRFTNNEIFFFYILTIDTGGSHNSSGGTLSSVISCASGSPGEQTSQRERGPSGFGFAT